MLYTIANFRNKQVVSVETGTVIGFVGDLEIETETGKVANLIIFGKNKLFGALGREDDIQIPWSNIEVVGDETVLVKGSFIFKNSKRKSF